MFQWLTDSIKTGRLPLKQIRFILHNGVLQGEVEVTMTPATYSRLISFLQEDLAISPASIAVAERAGGSQRRNRDQDSTSLPMVLWQYGLVSLEQLDKIFDWLATA